MTAVGVLAAGLNGAAGLEDDGLDVVLALASLEEASIEQGNGVDMVLTVGVVGPVAANETVDGALDAPRGLG